MGLPRVFRSRGYIYAVSATASGFLGWMISRDPTVTAIFTGIWAPLLASHGSRQVVDAYRGQQMNKQTGKLEKLE